MVDNNNDFFVAWLSLDDLPFAFNENTAPAPRVATKSGRRAEDEPTIEMTQAELEEMLRRSGWHENQNGAEAGARARETVR